MQGLKTILRDVSDIYISYNTGVLQTLLQLITTHTWVCIRQHTQHVRAHTQHAYKGNRRWWYMVVCGGVGVIIWW